METIQGRRSLELDLKGFNERRAGCHRIIIDIGTGDGRYVHTLAENNPRWFVIGLDSCRENLRKYSNRKLRNMLFIIASAQEIPVDLTGLVSHVTINFPWGSLLKSLLSGDSKLFCGIESISASVASFDIRLNSGALAEAGWELARGAAQIYNTILGSGWVAEPPAMMDAGALRDFPSSWAKRLAFGRDPHAIELKGWLSPKSLSAVRRFEEG